MGGGAGIPNREQQPRQAEEAEVTFWTFAKAAGACAESGEREESCRETAPEIRMDSWATQHDARRPGRKRLLGD